MRTSWPYHPKHPEHFEFQLLNFAAEFQTFAFFNGNGFDSGFQKIFTIGVFKRLRLDNISNPFDCLKEFIDKENDWVFGHFNYELKYFTENLKRILPQQESFSIIDFFIPEIIVQKDGDIFRFLVRTEHPLSQMPEKIVELIENFSNPLPVESKLPTGIKQRTSHQEYLIQVEKIKAHILRGDIYEANYCIEFFAEEAVVDPISLYRNLNQISKAPFSVLYRQDMDWLISASPERFLKKEGKKIIAQPIKGTARRGNTESEDLDFKIALSESIKEQSENIMIVDLVRNDLSKTAKRGSVKVEELCGIYTYPHVHQMISTISSEINDGIHPVDVIKEAFPMGSMTGAPKIRSMQIIEETEAVQRGIYSGAVGYFTPDQDFDFNVVIRSIVYNKNRKYLSYKVGSAITALSDANEEYEECILKASANHKLLSEEILIKK